MKLSTKNVTVCAAFGALQLIFLLCAKYLEFATGAFYVLTACALMVPFERKMYKEGILTYIAVSILSIFLVNFPESIVYITFVGGYTLIVVLLHEKKVNLILSYVIKIAWNNLVLLLFYFCFHSFIQVDLSGFNLYINLEYYHYVIAVTVLTILYDFFLRYVYKNLSIITKRIFK